MSALEKPTSDSRRDFCACVASFIPSSIAKAAIRSRIVTGPSPAGAASAASLGRCEFVREGIQVLPIEISVVKPSGPVRVDGEPDGFQLRGQLLPARGR